MIILVLVLYALSCAGFASFMAKRKQYDALAWFGLGFLFGLIALIALAGVPAKILEEKEEVLGSERRRSY